ncbi:hypothetical protein H0H10_16510 [Streptomyces sp. TRM S81-3]|uniref:Gram-positive cocci surface proteins LPxTG domain-containing protein n=1 Tax=Streptomyces griseicoloratus TaxID=2752516 RepID=A0A926QS81_9ACTN|nr:hypothetical protein [Streptomyces griseicoloratus]MBD0420727.1 hypothetical protein [Streptomyces griseicoloratus]
MRLFTPVSLCLTAAAALLTAAAPGATAPAPPACAAPDDRAFPLVTRIHGGPGTYRPGGGPGTWYLDLTNTTGRTCEGVHPVVVLVDAGRALKPSQARLEFHDGTRPHAVRFEDTDADELIGVFDDFPGLTVGPGRTVTVKVRLAFTADAVPDEVTVNAAAVQRRGGDGDWVGQSNDYRFRVAAGDSAEPRSSVTPAVAAPDDPAGGLPFADELAGTGLGRVGTMLAGAALLLGAGGTAVLLSRRNR